MESIDDVREGLTTAYIDGTAAANLAYKPSFVFNNHKKGKKVLSAVEDELLRFGKDHCINIS